jgi:hypothetical protein
MIVIEVLVGMLVFALGVTATAMLYFGLLAAMGAVRLVRCDHCGHLGATTPGAPLRSCPYCRHGWLLHPLHALHHESGSIESGLERPDGDEVLMVPSGGMEGSFGRSVCDWHYRGEGIQVRPRRGVGSRVQGAEVQRRWRAEEHSRR